MADTPIGETGTPTPLENGATNPTTPPIMEKKTDDGEVERLRKEKEQAEMRANQLANQLRAKEDAEASAKAQELKDKEEYKTLYEQKEAELEEIRRERETEAKHAATTEAADKVLSDYSDEVKEMAKEMGLSLQDATDDSTTEYKSKLDKIQARLGGQRVTPNNPGVPSLKKDISGEELRVILSDPAKRDAYYRSKDGVTAMMMNPPKS
jgi:DNA repair exonuclease SbcCD ATPase subunit